MGTWSLPDTVEKKRKALDIIDRVEGLKHDLYSVYGDDGLFDHLGGDRDARESARLSRHVPMCQMAWISFGASAMGCGSSLL